jgi:ATP-dependent RNA helicase RhlE
LVFTRTKHGANRLAEKLERDGISAAAIHGNKSQGARTKALSDFKQNAVRVLVATDIAARGLDIEQLPYVVNFELPNVPADYVHRIGRTGRAGANGQAISLVEPEEFSFLQAIEKLLKQKLPCEALPALPKGSAITKVDKPVANVKATDERAKQGQHRPKKRRTKSQKTEARVAAGLQTAKAPKLGVAASKPQRRPARKPAA